MFISNKQMDSLPLAEQMSLGRTKRGPARNSQVCKFEVTLGFGVKVSDSESNLRVRRFQSDGDT